MAKMRVYELAKELEVKPKELLELLATIGVTGKVPSSSIEETAARSLRQMIENRNNPQPDTPAEPEPAAPAPPPTFRNFRASSFRQTHREPAASSPRQTPSAAAAQPPAPEKEAPAKPSLRQAVRASTPAADKPAASRAATPAPSATPAPAAAPAAAASDKSEASANAPSSTPPAKEGEEKVLSTEIQDFRDTPAPPPGGATGASSAPARRPLGPGRRPGSGRGGDFRKFSGRGRRVERQAQSLEEHFAAAEEVEEDTLEAGSVVKISPNITVSELADKIGKSPSDLIKHLFSKSIMRSANQPLESDVAGQLLTAYGYKMEAETSRTERHLEEEDAEALVSVPPVVTVMGHVDHGKTSLLDVIRSSNVQSGEAGGITQRIGAYETEHNGERIVFLDTPGHEAFTRMRARGAHITDIAILVVAADDGIMPQTREAIDHARAARVPLIVAMNKMDRPEADPERLKGQLAELELIPEDYGGDTVTIPVSAKTGQGVQELLDMILLISEMQELKANPQGFAAGTIIEANQDPQRGPVATVLVHRGTLNVGDYIVVGEVSGRVRAMYDYKGEEVKQAGPKTPVSVIGLSAVPHASDTLIAVGSAREARDVAEEFTTSAKEGRMEGGRVSLSDLFAKIQKGAVKELNVIIKADGQGSVEAICHSLEKLAHEEVRVKIVSRGVGNVSENDVNLASASEAIVIAFAVGVDNAAASLADREGVEVRNYSVIYNAIDDVKDALEGLLDPLFEEQKSGEAEVVAVFESSRAGKIAGCRVRNGKLVAGAVLKILRRGEEVFNGKIDSLRHVKDSVKEMAAPHECGVSAYNFNDFQEGDMLQSWVQVQIKRKI